MSPRALVAAAVAAGLIAGGGSLVALARGADRALAAAQARVAVGAPPSLLGVELGATVDGARATLAARGVTCQDASIAAIAARAHAEARAKREAAGTPARPMTAATVWKHAQMLAAMPTQARLSCATAPAPAGRKAARPGRLLVVADAPTAPVTVASQQRAYLDPRSATADLREAEAALTAQLGAPTERTGDPEGKLGRYALVVRTWRAGEVIVSLRAVDLGKRGAIVTEELVRPAAKVAGR